MNIGMQTWGSQGDIQPFIALAEGLQDAGHDVTLAITCVDSDRYDRFISRAGVKIKLISSPVISDPIQLQKIGKVIFHEHNPIAQTQMVIEKLFLPVEAEMFKMSERLCAENDLVIGHFFHYPLNAAAERYRRPYISVALVHGAVPSIFEPPSGIPTLGTFGNRLAWRLARSVLNKKLKKYPDRLRVKNGIEVAGDLIDNVWASEQLTLLAISRTICVRKSDWPDYYQVCGVLNTRDPLEGNVSKELQGFLSDGTLPLYMTFGSAMSGSDEKETISLLSNAAKTASMRAVIQAPGWEKCGFKSNDAIHYVSSDPHAVIFPQCRAIVRHGGAGTSQSALFAGKPSVVVAHTSEQELWGRELERIGVAPKLLLRRKLTSNRLAAAIKRVAGSKDFNEKANNLGMEMAKENGVATAVKMISAKFIG